MRISRWLADYEPGDRCAGRAPIFDRIKIRSSAPALRATMACSGSTDLDEDAAVGIEGRAAARRNNHAGVVFLHHERPVSRLAGKAVTEVLEVLKKTGGSDAVKDRMITFAEWTELTGLPEARALEERYGTDGTRLPRFTTGPLEPQQRR